MGFAQPASSLYAISDCIGMLNPLAFQDAKVVKVVREHDLGCILKKEEEDKMRRILNLSVLIEICVAVSSKCSGFVAGIAVV